MAQTPPTIVWFTRDLRLGDLPALEAALQDGGAVIPVFIAEPEDPEHPGAALQWRLAQSVRSLAANIEALGGRLITRRGAAASVLSEVVAETKAAVVRCSESRHPDAEARFQDLRAAVSGSGADLIAHSGRYLAPRGLPLTKSGGFFKVYTPFWRALHEMLEHAPPQLAPQPTVWPIPSAWPRCEPIEELGLELAMRRGADVVARHAEVGEAAALRKLRIFLESRVGRYQTGRDFMSVDAVSGLSAHLACGEMSPRQIWVATRERVDASPEIAEGALHFLKELAWREFAWSLVVATPQILRRNWRQEWDQFPWRGDNEDAEAWRRGETGVDLVDAAMRELYTTGVMHNRARMLVASYLTKHLLTDWRVGEAWFRDCLVDFDPASNAMGWQWVAGSGPDAAPFFRIFNPETQAAKFDPDCRYRATWLPERFASDLFNASGDGPAAGFFDAAPVAWGLRANVWRPSPRIELKEGRARALDAYKLLSRSN